ncbi:MAG: hypothetical protein LBL07_02820 [Tannerella sp.]|jgi:hypothetical protein|nr:hypothetical protein [Tannerella sp.]
MNKIIKSSCVGVFMCFYCSLYAQLQSHTDGHYEETNLFEYGAPLTSSEINFKNLFDNFPRFVKNANEVDLLSYKYVDVIKNRKQARNFVKKNIYHAPGWGASLTVYESASGNAPKQQTDIRLDFSGTVGSDKSEWNEIIKTISEEYIQTGYEIYMIKFVCRLKTCEYYVFVNPETRQVVTKGNIFGFSFPALHLSD